MSQCVETPCKSFTAGAARAAFLRVKLSGTSLATAGATDVSIGVQEFASLATTDIVPVRLVNAPGTRKMVASEPITAGNPVYAAAGGKIAASGTVIEGRALEDAGADNDVIEVLGIQNTDLSASIATTNAAAFEVDSDAATPKIALSGQAAGTGDFTTTLKPETTLSADNAIIVPEADGDTLVAVALAQTLTNKTLTAPSIAIVDMTGTTGSQEIRLTTNLADALSIEDTAGDLMVFTTTTGSQSITVTPTLILSGNLRWKAVTTPVAAAGSTVADAGQLGAGAVAHITSDGATKGVKLRTGAMGDFQFVINNSGTAAELYAASGGTVNGASADASVVVPASKGVLCFCTAADTWIVFDLPAKASAS